MAKHEHHHTYIAERQSVNSKYLSKIPVVTPLWGFWCRWLRWGKLNKFLPISYYIAQRQGHGYYGKLIGTLLVCCIDQCCFQRCEWWV